ncbi:hypothetical protein [Streptomyces sp. NPDC051211]|uniref:hypothetical protein n=1 Tax=Streptomyces sp. NPDC051211 TaxID=3154643 RepID=UPI00344B630E
MRNFLKSSLVAVAATVVCCASATVANAAVMGGDGIDSSNTYIGSGNTYNYEILSGILNLLNGSVISL